MERLTFDGNFCDIAQCRELPCQHGGNCTQKQVWERLKQFEDTGLSPIGLEHAAEIEKGLNESGYSMERWAELMKSDKEGQVVVLPCKPGDTVYRTFIPHGRPPVISAHTLMSVDYIVRWLDKFGKTVFLTREEAEEAGRRAKK